MKVLVLGLNNKAGLAVARNLNKAGYEVDAIYFKDLAARHSRYINEAFDFGNPESDVGSFFDQFLSHLKKAPYDALIPISDMALEICRYKIGEISALVKVVGINVDEVYKYSIDKNEMLKIGQEYGLEVPKSHFVDSLEAFRKIDLSTLEFPLVAKPVGSAKVLNNRVVGYSVKICQSSNELVDFVRENINCTTILIQEFISGYGIGYNFVAKEGRIQNAYIHKRINENKGVSSLRESCPTTTYGLQEKVTRTVAAMKWSGVGMVEFMIKSDDTPVLMEFNGRFFGSTELSARSGINLPVLFARQFIEEIEIPENLPLKKARVRFFHDELVLFTSYLFQKKPGRFFKWLGDLFLSLFQRNHYFETTIFNDFGFSRAFYVSEFKRLKAKRNRKKGIRKIIVNPLQKEDLNGLKSVNFFCLGNICRSPFAELKARQLTDQYQFSSLGSINKVLRMSPTNAVTAAKDFGVEMESHRSNTISAVNVDEIDMFVVMDRGNAFDLMNQGIPESKIRFLANEELPDPYGKSVEEFGKIYAKIETELKRVF
jgi:protein-tyrosine-phosphatase/predicted ATP-grasp superfamily ATP-dependent carboligase